MSTRRHNIRFPSIDTNNLSQDEAYFTLTDSNGVETDLRFHDYDAIYAREGLYEQLFYDRLKCHSPEKVVAILRHAMAEEPWLFNELRVLDLGAGNGMVGEELQKFGVARLVGVDISAPAAMAVVRDRPGVYDDFNAMDMSNMSPAQHDHLAGWRFNCMVSVAALGFGDIPVRVFAEAFNLVDDGGWIAFNIKETFLDDRDTSGFSVFIKTLILSEYLDIYHMERYRHRLSIDGQPLYYFGVACRDSEGESWLDSEGDARSAVALQIRRQFFLPALGGPTRVRAPAVAQPGAPWLGTHRNSRLADEGSTPAQGGAILGEAKGSLGANVFDSTVCRSVCRGGSTGRPGPGRRRPC